MKLPKPYNSYNIFFILERALLLELRKSYAPGTASGQDSDSSSSPHADTLGYYGPVDLPPLPPRYRHLASILPANWYDPGRNRLSKRKHSKTHGAVSFREMAKTVATNWKALDPVTKSYVESLAALLKRCHAEVARLDNGEWMMAQMPTTKTKKKIKDAALKTKLAKACAEKCIKPVVPNVTSSSFVLMPRQVSLTESMETTGSATHDLIPDVMPKPRPQEAAIADYVPPQLSQYEHSSIMPATVLYLSPSRNTIQDFFCFQCVPQDGTIKEMNVAASIRPFFPPPLLPTKRTISEDMNTTLDSSLCDMFSDCAPLDHLPPALNDRAIKEVDMSDMEILASYFSD